MLIDTHCHLNFKAFQTNLDQVIKNAYKAGVRKIIVPGANLDSSLKAVKITLEYKNIYAAVGIHPIHAAQEFKIIGIEKLKLNLYSLAKNKKVVAIGECGFDYYYKKTKLEKQIQKKIFLMQIKLAHKLKLPLIIHNRNASNDLIQLIINHQSLITNSGVFHCFEGGKKQLSRILNLNFFVGINGLVTYNTGLQETIKHIPLNKILLETDAPFLIPEPLKSKKVFPNEPKNVKIIAAKIASLKGDSFFKLKKQTGNNANVLFKLKNESK